MPRDGSSPPNSVLFALKTTMHHAMTPIKVEKSIHPVTVRTAASASTVSVGPSAEPLEVWSPPDSAGQRPLSRCAPGTALGWERRGPVGEVGDTGGGRGRKNGSGNEKGVRCNVMHVGLSCNIFLGDSDRSQKKNTDKNTLNTSSCCIASNLGALRRKVAEFSCCCFNRLTVTLSLFVFFGGFEGLMVFCSQRGPSRSRGTPMRSRSALLTTVIGGTDDVVACHHNSTAVNGTVSSNILCQDCV